MRDPLGRAIDRRGAVGHAILLSCGCTGVFTARRGIGCIQGDRPTCRHAAQGRIGIVQGGGGTEGAGAEPALAISAPPRSKAQAHHLAPVQLGLHDLLSIALGSQRQLVFPTGHGGLFCLVGVCEANCHSGRRTKYDIDTTPLGNAECKLVFLVRSDALTAEPASQPRMLAGSGGLALDVVP